MISMRSLRLPRLVVVVVVVVCFHPRGRPRAPGLPPIQGCARLWLHLLFPSVLTLHLHVCLPRSAPAAAAAATVVTRLVTTATTRGL